MRHRPAKPGDCGTLLGIQSFGTIGRLLIQKSPHLTVYVQGDHRPVRNIFEALRGREVKVMESEGSAYGCHSIRPLDEDDGGDE